MLPIIVKENISSINPSELEKLYRYYLKKVSPASVGDFMNKLYKNKKISSQEYKSFQAQKQVDPDIENSIQSAADKLKSIPDRKGYTILEPIDFGAMGEILLAKDNKLGRTVAYKRIHRKVAKHPGFMSRFIMEAQITARLEHPGIIPVYALIADGEEVGYAMKLINGITLRDLIKETSQQYRDRGKPDEKHGLQARLEHFLKVCDAMHYAHRKGVIHRDLKPINIMIGSYNEVYVMDWGIAKVVEVDKKKFSDKTVALGGSKSGLARDFDKTRRGQVMGTLQYMSPEQAEGSHDNFDHRSDIYALGLILFEIVTLHKAMNGKTQDQVRMKAIMGKIDPPPKYNKQKDEQEVLLAIVNKATQFNPGDRYATVEEFSYDIRCFMHGESVSALPDRLKHKVMRWISKHRRATINIGILTMTISLLLVGSLLYLYIQLLEDMMK